MTAPSESARPDTMPGLTTGRIVHYVLREGPNIGEHRPAIVVQIWDASQSHDLVNLQVFVDGLNDAPRNRTVDNLNQGYFIGLMWATGISYSEAKEPGTWHWIEKA